MKLFKARCSANSQIMSNPQGGSNLDKYNDLLDSIAETSTKIEACSEKALKTKEKLTKKLTELTIQKPILEAKKDEIRLSATCLKHVENWIKETYYKRSFQIDTMPIRKGNETEIEATSLVSSFLNEKFTRDNKTLSNDYLTGHLDIDWSAKKVIIDTKVCKDFSTFPILDKEIELAYYWQGQGYMDLTGYDECWFAKCAINTPIHELERMEKATWFRLMDIYGDENSEYFQADWLEFMKNLYMAHVIDNSISIKGYTLDSFEIPEIPKEERVKIIKVKREQSDIDLIKPRVEEVRAFLKQNNF